MSKIKQEKLFEFLSKHPGEDIDLEELEEFCNPSKKMNKKEEFDEELFLEEPIADTSNDIKAQKVLSDYDREHNVEEIHSSSEPSVGYTDAFNTPFCEIEDETTTLNEILEHSKAFTEPVKVDNINLHEDDLKDILKPSKEIPYVRNSKFNLAEDPFAETQKEFVKFMKSDEEVLCKKRAEEIKNLLIGRTKKPALNGKINFETAVDLLDGNISVISLAKKVYSEEMDIYDRISENIIKIKDKMKKARRKYVIECDKSCEVINDNNEIRQLGLKGERLSYTGTRLFHYILRLDKLEFDKSLCFEEWLMARLNPSKNLMSKVGNISALEYICDYLERFKMFVDDIFKLTGVDNAPSEIKLLYAITLSEYEHICKGRIFSIFKLKNIDVDRLKKIKLDYISIILILFKDMLSDSKALTVENCKEVLDYLDKIIEENRTLLEQLNVPNFKVECFYDPIGFNKSNYDSISCYSILSTARKNMYDFIKCYKFN